MGHALSDPFPRRHPPPGWPVPPDGPPHPAWPCFAELRSERPDRREAGLAALLALEPAELPHPSRRPAAWDPELRGFARTLLWRLYRRFPYRVDGLEIRLEHRGDEPPRVGAPAGLGLTVRNIDGLRRPRFPVHLDHLEQIGGRLLLFSRPAGSLRPGRAASVPDDAPPLEPVRDSREVRAAALDGATFGAPGVHEVVAVVDLTDAKDRQLPCGLLVSNRLRLEVRPPAE
jgi:hypothetical protein